MSLTDGEATIDAVVWSSQVSRLSFQPQQEDGVLVIGKLNFWKAQARLTINVIDLKPSISTVLRKFEIVSKLLDQEGLLDEKRKKDLPRYPNSIAILTSVPSSALADMLRTAKERWPMTKLFIVPIPVQGEGAAKILAALQCLSSSSKELKLDALVLARGGGSREDLMIFDNEKICREIASCPIPVITGIGHEDDLTVADLVSDHRAATPTAAIVDLLPSREIALSDCFQKKQRISDYFLWFIKDQRNILRDKIDLLTSYSPDTLLRKHQNELIQKKHLLNALSPDHWLKKGFCIVRNKQGQLLTSVSAVKEDDLINIQFDDGNMDSKVKSIYYKE